MAKILNDFQKKFLKEIGKSNLRPYFIWSGGTALSYQYLRHRLSYDLDFLSKDLAPDNYLLSEVNKIAKKLRVKKIEEQKKFNRHEFWLMRDKETLRVEFVFYPFPTIKTPKLQTEFKIKIDSFEDILTNKIHAIFERVEPKDAFDVYCMLQQEKIKFLTLFRWVKKKFGVEIDPVLFISKVLAGADKLGKIKPLILKEKLFRPSKIRDFFEKEAQDYLKKEIKI